MKKTKQTYEKLNVDVMNNYQLSRWLALTEAVNIIAEMADDKRADFENINLKPIAIEKYVDNMSDIINRRLNEEDDPISSINSSYDSIFGFSNKGKEEHNV